jgi:hypothetical protein
MQPRGLVHERPELGERPEQWACAIRAPANERDKGFFAV